MTTPAQKCGLTVGLLEYLFKNPLRAVVVGPYKGGNVAAVVAAFNRAKGRGYAIRIFMRKVLMVDPVTATTEIMWEVRLAGAQSVEIRPRKKWTRKH